MVYGLIKHLLNLGPEPVQDKPIVCIVSDNTSVRMMSEDVAYFHNNPDYIFTGVVDRGQIQYWQYEFRNSPP